MPLIRETLGNVLVHIYDFPFLATIYLPDAVCYETDTPCLVAWFDGLPTMGEQVAHHQMCLNDGFKNWLNVAVVSDTCDEVPQQAEVYLLEAFNKDCCEGGWLWKNMNYRNPETPGSS